jgi:hypothetical protein
VRHRTEVVHHLDQHTDTLQRPQRRQHTIKDLDERAQLILEHTDPAGILTSAPGIGPVIAIAILGRLGDPNRFASLAGARAFTGLVPTLTHPASPAATTGRQNADAVLREALFQTADATREIDPTRAAKYHRLMVQTGKHRNSALCHSQPPCSPPRRRLLARRPAPPSPRQRRRTSQQRPSQSNHRRQLHHPDRPTYQTSNHDSDRDGTAKQEVAQRSVNRPVHLRRSDNPHSTTTSATAAATG